MKPTLLVNADDILAKQLALKAPADMTFANGQKTALTPVAYVPRVDGAANVLSLDGAWHVTKWPFHVKEERLVAPATSDAKWAEVEQPGKVFYADPEADTREIPKWDRVGLDHIADDDGAVMRRTALIPRAWRGRRVYLRFDSIYPAGRVYLNGELLGEHTSGLTPVEYDVTDRVRPGRQALVAVRLLRKHRFVKMDMVRHALEFAGLAQSACFHATEPCQINDYHLVTGLAADLAGGDVVWNVSCNQLCR